MEVKREHKINFLYVIAAFLAVLLIQDYLLSAGSFENDLLQ